METNNITPTSLKVRAKTKDYDPQHMPEYMEGYVFPESIQGVKHWCITDGVLQFEIDPSTIQLLHEDENAEEGKVCTIAPYGRIDREPVKEEKETRQVGGNHYGCMAIDPMTYAMENRLNAGQFSVVKYISRYPLKNGLEDLLKAKSCIDILIDMEYPEH